jgi:WD40 repeat protein
MKNVLLEKPKECCLGDFQFSPSARWVLFGDNYWNTSTGNVNTIVGCTLNPTFTADEKRLMTSCGDGNIKLWDLESGQEVLKIKAHDSDVNTIFMMPDNAHMLTATKKDVSVWRLRF